MSEKNIPSDLQIRMKHMRGFFKSSYLFPLVLLFLLLLGAYYLTLRNNPAPSQAVVTDDQRVEVRKPKKTQAINKEFSFPLKDRQGKEVSKISYTIQTAELRDEIIVKGERATAVKGRQFLILNLKITNTYNQMVQINSRDYVRLTVNNNNEFLAPEIHNDPVEAQAISTKYTRLGFPINDTDKNLILHVGEITGKKTQIPLTLQ